MIVYADILITLNLIVDYFLLLAAGGLLHRRAKLWRMLLAAGEGALFSLYIFLPQSVAAVELVLRIVICFLMSFTAFGFGNLKEFLKAAGTFFLVTCLYAGTMTAIWKIFKPNGMVINNSVVYFDISAVALIVCTVVSYFIFLLFSRIFASNGKYAENCRIKVSAMGHEAEFSAILDTGNSVSDIFGGGEVIITDKSVLKELFGNTDININQALKSRFRMIPLSTVSGADVLEAFRCDSAEVLYESQRVCLKNPILAVSKIPFDSGYKGVVNPKILENSGGEYDTKNQKAFK